MTAPTRIAFAGDWHGNTLWAKAAIEHAKDRGAHTIVHLGDFGYHYNVGFLSAINLSLHRTGLTLEFVDGNHENFSVLHGERFPVLADGRRRVGPRIFHLPRGHRWTWGGVRFLGLGGAHSVDRQWRRPHLEWWPEETITAEQAAAAAAAGPADVLVSHDCPAGVTIPTIDENRPIDAPKFPAVDLERSAEHRALLRTVVDAVRPRWVWHGHYHVAYGRTVDLGYGPVRVRGLDMEGTTAARNVHVVDVDDLLPDDAVLP